MAKLISSQHTHITSIQINQQTLPKTQSSLMPYLVPTPILLTW